MYNLYTHTLTFTKVIAFKESYCWLHSGILGTKKRYKKKKKTRPLDPSKWRLFRFCQGQKGSISKFRQFNHWTWISLSLCQGRKCLNQQGGRLESGQQGLESDFQENHFQKTVYANLFPSLKESTPGIWWGTVKEGKKGGFSQIERKDTKNRV